MATTIHADWAGGVLPVAGNPVCRLGDADDWEVSFDDRDFVAEAERFGFQSDGWQFGVVKVVDTAHHRVMIEPRDDAVTISREAP